MLKTLIVDDEKLVRSEIKKLVNWLQFGIEIVGEAENGRAAMQFLSSNEVDFMISDLTMPGLSGIEFLSEVRKLYPKLKIVVMTMHQDFNLVQQAMRLGAIDYIAKTQIEDGKFDNILKDILKRMAQVQGDECCEAHNITVIKKIKTECSEEDSIKFTPCSSWFKFDDETYMSDKENEIPPLGFLAMRFSGCFGVPFRQISNRVNECFNKQLFYQYTPNITQYSFNLIADSPVIMRRRDEAAVIFKGMDWLLDDKVYINAVNEIPSLELSKDELTVFLYQPYLTCAPYLKLEPSEFFSQIQGFIWWYMWKKWLDDLREKTSLCLWPEDSPTFAIHKAISFVERNYATDISLPQILELVGMGKSSFSACFKEKTGKTFVNYIKYIRIQKAKKLLLETDQSIAKVGELVGYLDERYFRRVFFECEKMTPSQYRK